MPRFSENYPWIAFWRINEAILPSSEVDRFLFRKKPKKAMPSDFMGSISGEDISVFETSHIKEEAVWKIGQKINPNVSVKARLTLKVLELKALHNDEEQIKFDLLVKRSPQTAKAKQFTFLDKWWHVDISNCPQGDERYKLMATSLCQIANYKPKAGAAS